MIKMVAAVARDNLVIGNDGKLPWNLVSEKNYFYRLVREQIVVMGYGTWCAMGGPVINALSNWVLTARHGSLLNLATASRHADLDCNELQKWQRSGRLRVFSTWQCLLRECLSTKPTKDLMIIGGSELYHLMLPYANRLYLTLIDGEFIGDRFFPEWRQNSEWILTKSCNHVEQQVTYQCTIWIRLRQTT